MKTDIKYFNYLFCINKNRLIYNDESTVVNIFYFLNNISNWICAI